jgi:hypothetical protein
MVDKECNLRAGVYKVQTFGTTQRLGGLPKLSLYISSSNNIVGEGNERE